MHKEVLTKKQEALLPFLKNTFKDFGLVRGTAIALHLGHRQSIDFDLFSNKEFDNSKVRRMILKNNKKIDHVYIDQRDEYTVLIDDVKFTFLYYPFKIDFLKEEIKIPDLLTLAAMKTYALGRRNKWKDYVDLYFILKDSYPLEDIIKRAEEIFKNEFNDKVFKTQLAYFEDIDYSEEVIFQEGFEVSQDIIKKELTRFSLS